MADNAVPSTKKLKSMLKMLTEHGVARYKDSEIEIEFSGFMPAQSSKESESFNISKYEEPKRPLGREGADDLGLTEEDYLNWSANA